MNDMVEAIYSNAKGFATNNAKYGDTSVERQKAQLFLQ